MRGRSCWCPHLIRSAHPHSRTPHSRLALLTRSLRQAPHAVPPTAAARPGLHGVRGFASPPRTLFGILDSPLQSRDRVGRGRRGLRRLWRGNKAGSSSEFSGCDWTIRCRHLEGQVLSFSVRWSCCLGGKYLGVRHLVVGRGAEANSYLLQVPIAVHGCVAPGKLVGWTNCYRFPIRILFPTDSLVICTLCLWRKFPMHGVERRLVGLLK
jgi:hypothetical protein